MNHEIREKEILAYYRRLWGIPITASRYSHTIEKAPDPITILEFATPEHDVWIYTTLGMSRQTLAHPHAVQDTRIELFMFSNQAQGELVNSLGSLAVYPFALDTYFGEGHTILGEEGMIPDSPLTDILITRMNFGEDIPDYVHHSDSSHTHLFWIVPIYRAERLFAKERGWRSLVAVFEEHETDVVNLWRPCAI